jgi:hypothetical protein
VTEGAGIDQGLDEEKTESLGETSDTSHFIRSDTASIQRWPTPTFRLRSSEGWWAMPARTEQIPRVFGGIEQSGQFQIENLFVATLLLNPFVFSPHESDFCAIGCS